MMTFDSLVAAAWLRKDILPDTLIETRTYECLRTMYDRFRANPSEEEKERCARTKACLKEQYEGDCVMYAAYQEGARREQAASLMVLEIERDGCDVCRRLMRLMDGRERVKEDV